MQRLTDVKTLITQPTQHLVLAITTVKTISGLFPWCVVFKDVDAVVFAMLICTIRERQAEFKVISCEWPDSLIRFERERRVAKTATELA